jgi:hypothetical protein
MLSVMESLLSRLKHARRSGIMLSGILTVLLAVACLPATESVRKFINLPPSIQASSLYGRRALFAMSAMQK